MFLVKFILVFYLFVVVFAVADVLFFSIVFLKLVLFYMRRLFITVY